MGDTPDTKASPESTREHINASPLMAFMEKSQMLIKKSSAIVNDEKLSLTDKAYLYLQKSAPGLYVIVFFVVNLFVWIAFEPEWNYAESFYFICASLTTVGYGDRTPSDDWGRLYCIVFLLLAITTVFPILSDAMDWALTKIEFYAIGEVSSTTGGTQRQHRKIVFSAAVIFLVIITGTTFMATTHNWSFLEALYWSFVTSLTVGYGDVLGRHNPGTLLFVSCYMMISTMTIAVAIQNFVEVSADARQKKEREEAADKIDILHLLLDHMDGGLDGEISDESKKKATEKGIRAKISKDEFILYMLKMTNVVSEGEAEHWENKFAELDISGNGVLDLDDIKEMEGKAKEKEERKRDTPQKGKKDESKAGGGGTGPRSWSSVAPDPAENA